MASDKTNEDKRNHLYRKIIYARETLLSLPQASPLFKLRNRGKYLPIQQYAENLAQYLGSFYIYEHFDNE